MTQAPARCSASAECISGGNAIQIGALTQIPLHDHPFVVSQWSADRTNWFLRLSMNSA
jgi:hypothetical protein